MEDVKIFDEANTMATPQVKSPSRHRNEESPSRLRDRGTSAGVKSSSQLDDDFTMDDEQIVDDSTEATVVTTDGSRQPSSKSPSSSTNRRKIGLVDDNDMEEGEVVCNDPSETCCRWPDHRLQAGYSGAGARPSSPPKPKRHKYSIDPSFSSPRDPPSDAEAFDYDYDYDVGYKTEKSESESVAAEEGLLGGSRRRSLITYAAPAVAVHSPVSTSFCLPHCFGVHFVVETIMGHNGEYGKRLCTEFCCWIDIGGRLIYKDKEDRVKGGGDDDDDDDFDDDDCDDGKGDNLLIARVKGPSLQNLHKFQFAIENRLFFAVDSRLRGCLLFAMGEMNNHREKRDGIIQSRNPYYNPHHREDMRYITVVEVGSSTRTTNGEAEIVGMEDAKKLKEELKRKFRWLSVCLVEQEHLKGYPLLGPHIVLSSPYFNDIRESRTEFQPWLRYPKPSEPCDCTDP